MTSLGGKSLGVPTAGVPIIVGIGASAGALGVLQQFFSIVPSDGGLVFVVVQHLDRHHPSVLAELLGRHTLMPVRQAEDGVRALPNHVYIIPPSSALTLEKGLLRVTPADALARSFIDGFFRSLALDQGERAVGIILSGAGSDGTAGMRAIKEYGGLTLAQAPETAKYDSMPQSAIAGGLVDFALPIEEMPGRLQAHARSLADRERAADVDLDQQVTDHLGSICDILTRQTGDDFRQYKPGTLLRRIRRRVQLLGAATVAEYVRHLEQAPAEVQSLHRDLLIGVTHFFRDPDAFSALALHALPAIVGEGGPSAAVRIWVPGCASGEEAYSLAILVSERLARVGGARPVQIFATDMDADLLAAARLGRYPDKIGEHLSAERLERFFVREDKTYRVAGDIRAMCTFSEHSLIKDPPFSMLDLVSCRNVLIYLGPDLQKKLVPLFHYALKPGGFLLLGPSESLAAHSELFTPVDARARLFRRNEGVPRPAIEFPLTGRRDRPPASAAHEATPPTAPQPFSHAFERMILEEYAPPSAVVNEQGDILYLAGRAGRYLQVATGVPSNNVFDLAEGRLRVALRTALASAVRNRGIAVRDRVPLNAGGDPQLVRITARPLPGVAPDTRLYAIVLQGVSSDGDTARDGDGATVSEESIVEELENELRTTRSDLQSALQELETANEELKSANEELVSTNEELQSANEELQTSKEELQSANDELHSKVLELDSATSDLQHHYAGTQIATIFLDDDLRITRFTPAAAALFNVRESDRGRPFRDLAPRFVEEDVLGDVRSVLTSVESVERRAHRTDGSAWYLVRMMPHRRPDATAAGLGVTFVDITALVRAEEAERRYGKLLQFSPDAVFAWRLDGGIETWNRGAEELYGFSPAEAMGKAPRDLLRATYPRPWAEVEAALREHERWQGEIESRGADGRALVVMATLSLLRGEDGVRRVLQSDRDITQRKAQAAERERLIEILREADRRKNEFLAILSHELRNPLAPIRNSLFILDRAVPTGEQAQRARAVIGRQVTQLTRIVDDLLDVTRIARAKLQVERARLDVGGLLRRTVEDHRTIFVDAGVDVDVRADEGPVWVNGDSARLAQAIGNVLSNAAKFTRRGGHVLVTLEQDVRRMVAVIRIRDDGAGMTPDLLERVFEPFAQADATLDRSRGGLGLGLAIVKGVIEQHEGDVEARSDGIGQGAEFTIHLPLLAEAEPVGAAVAGPSPLRNPRRVLVIEDNVDAAESLREALELMEHQVAVAYDGADGLKKAREFRPDVVLCDVGLPVKSGYEVARDLRADETLRSVWLVALTGYGLAEDIALVREVGFDQHLVKPVGMEKLAYVLEARTRNPDDDPARRR